jgi:hypothetical protein
VLKDWTSRGRGPDAEGFGRRYRLLDRPPDRRKRPFMAIRASERFDERASDSKRRCQATVSA